MRTNIDIVEKVASWFAGVISLTVNRSVDSTRVFNYPQWEPAIQRASAALAVELGRGLPASLDNEPWLA